MGPRRGMKNKSITLPYGCGFVQQYVTDGKNIVQICLSRFGMGW